MTTRREKLLLLALFAVAFAVRAAYYRDELGAPPLQPDGFYYHRLAVNVLRGRGYEVILGTGHAYKLYRPPGYPIFLASLYALIGVRYAAVNLLSIALSSAAVIVLFYFNLFLSGKRAAWCTAALAAFYWRAVLWSGIYRAETLCMLLLILSLYYLARSREVRGVSLPSISGALLGLAWLVRPNMIGILPFTAAWLLLRRGVEWGDRARGGLFHVLAFGLAISPWLVYNGAGRGLPLTDSVSTVVGAISLWQANNPEVGDEVDNHALEKLNRLRYANHRLDEPAWCALLRRQAGEFFRRDPWRCVRLSLLRFRKHWLAAAVMDGKGTIYPDDGGNREGIRYGLERFWRPAAYLRDAVIVEGEYKKRLSVPGLPLPLLTFEGLFYLSVLSAALGALVRRRAWLGGAARALRAASPLLVVAAGYTLFSLAGFAHQRIRLPLEYLLLLSAGWSVGALLFGPDAAPPPQEIRGTRRRGWALLAAIAAWSLLSCVTVRHAVSRSGAALEAMSRARPSGEQAVRAFASRFPAAAGMTGTGPGFGEVRERQMRHGGDLGPYLGATAVWTGEATFIRPVPEGEIRNEPLPYRSAWAMAPAGSSRPIFIRLVIGSYADPRSLGEGELLVVSDERTAEGIGEGDQVSVLGRIAGADNEVMGYILVFGDAFAKWGEGGGSKSQIPNPKDQINGICDFDLPHCLYWDLGFKN